LNFNKKVSNLFSKYSQEDIAIYNPNRALNFLYLNKLDQVRLIDDSSESHQKYLPTLFKPIENFESLVLHPPKIVIIFSRTFGERIKQKITEIHALKNVVVLTLNDL
jgi:hypothetical protein